MREVAAFLTEQAVQSADDVIRDEIHNFSRVQRDQRKARRQARSQEADDDDDDFDVTVTYEP